MGEPERTVFNVGCPGTDLLLQTPAIDRHNTLKKINKEIIKSDRKLNPNKPYLFVVQHPVTTEFESVADQMNEILGALKHFKEQIIILWPNIDAGSDEASKVLRRFYSALTPEESKKIVVLKHIPTEIFVNVLRNASSQIGNSSSGIREACYFGTPVVNIGSRQSGRERGKNVLDVECNKEKIVRAIKHQLAHGKYSIEYIYGDGKAGQNIAEILATVKLPNIQKRITY
jgi:UDP-hydrolysing UDP-N-acetyl-D-glucosamine 2-epimerase